MSSDLDSSLTSIDWLPQLGISSLRSGKERAGGERDKKKVRGTERGGFLPSVPDTSPSNSKGKPPHSYATLIAMAIASAPERKLSLNDIYTWISDTFPYYSRAGRGWKVADSTVLILEQWFPTWGSGPHKQFQVESEGLQVEWQERKRKTVFRCHWILFIFETFL